MKKIRLFIITIISAFIVCTPAFAATNLESSISSAQVGDLFEVSVEFEAAAWNVHISSSGPVSGCTLADADVTEDAKDTIKKFSTSCKAIAPGTIEISLSGDYTTEAGATTVLSDTISFSVTEPTQQTNETIENNEQNEDNNENKSDNPKDDAAIEPNDDVNNNDSNTPNTGKNTNEEASTQAIQNYLPLIITATILFIVGFFIKSRSKSSS